MPYFLEQCVIGRHGFTFGGLNLQLRIEIGEERGDKVGESVESAQYNDQCHCRHRHAEYGDQADDVDGMCALFREEVTAGDVKGEVHAGG